MSEHTADTAAASAVETNGQAADGQPDAVEMPSETELRTAMKSVYDPEIGLSVEDLGLVYGFSSEGKKVIVNMTLTTPMCPLGPVINSQTYSVLTSRFPQIEDVELNLVWEPRWDPRTMASEEAKAELGIW
jgi:metal-sulfur cluster biosynthetic enzyme